MRYVYLFAVALLSLSCVSINANVNADTVKDTSSFSEAETGIRLVMKQQELDWNNHDLEGFMKGYWRSDSLKFYGRSGLTLGWENTLNNYKKNYPTSLESGKLTFVINDISNIEGDSYWVMGEYHLERQIGNASGVFTIIFKKINGEWKIIADTTC